MMLGMHMRRSLVVLSVTLMFTGMLTVFLSQAAGTSGEIIAPDLSFSTDSSTQMANGMMTDLCIQIGTMMVLSDGASFTFTPSSIFILIVGTVVAERRDETPSKLRSRIVNEVSENPGIHLRELRRAVGCAMGALQYHINDLEEKCTLKSIRNGNTKHFFVAGFSEDEEVLRLASMLRNPTVKSVISQCRDKGSVTQAELSRTLDIDKSLVSYYTSGLVESGVLKTIRSFGRERPLMLSEWAQNKLHAVWGYV